MQKEYKAYHEILEILKNRGMIINAKSVSSIIKILEKENYYNIINGYKNLFIHTPATTSTEEKYKNGVTFDEVYALYNFDRELRIIYLKYILKIENHFKSVLSHIFSKKYGHDNYIKLENFSCGSSSNRVADVIRLIGDIQQEIARQLNKHNEMVSHYMTVHGYIPLWVLVNVLTFGKVTTFYFHLKDQDKIAIAKQFGVQEEELHKYMDMLGFARNKCAHDERFFNIKFKKALHTKSIQNFSILNLPKDKSGSYIKGTADVYGLTIIFRRLLSKQDFNEFFNSINSVIGKFSKKLKTISIDDVLNEMGYTSSWQNITKL